MLRQWRQSGLERLQWLGLVLSLHALRRTPRVLEAAVNVYWRELADAVARGDVVKDSLMQAALWPQMMELLQLHVNDAPPPA